MKSSVAFLGMALLSACGEGYSAFGEVEAGARELVMPPGSGEVEGTLNGRAFEIEEAVFFEVPSQDPDDPGKQVVTRFVVLSERPGLCADLRAGAFRRGSGYAVVFVAPGPTEVVTAGTYSISTQVQHYPGAAVTAGFLNEDCAPVDPVAALVGGTVTVDVATSTVIAGQFEGGFGMPSETLRGHFEATFCDVALDLDTPGVETRVCLE